MIGKAVNPQLRFPEFSKDYKENTIQDLINSKAIIGHLDGNHGELYPKAEEFCKDPAGVPYISANNFFLGEVDFSSVKRLPIRRAEKFKKGIAKDGDVLFAHNATVGPVALLKTKLDFVILSTTATYFRCDLDLISNIYFKFCLEVDSFVRQCHRVKFQSTRLQVPITAQRKFKLFLPEVDEQQKTGDFLSSVDKKIRLLKEKHVLLEKYKKGVMDRLFSQEVRFKDRSGNDFPDWIEDRLDSFVVKVSDPVKVDPDATYREIGVRSHAKGVFHKKPIKGCELGNKRVFWVHSKAFIVNIVFAWEHAVALTSESESGFIASHRFPMFIPKENRVDLRYFAIFFRSKRGKHLLGLASPGGAGRNKTLGQSNFAELKLTIPCIEEQARIADFYESLDNKVKLVAQQIEQTQIFKKGLLQQMFV